MAHATEIPPHAPETGRARRILGDFHVTGLFWYRFHRWAVATMPEVLIAPIIAIFTTLFFCTILRIRRAIARNLEVALGSCGPLERQRRIYRTMWNFAWCLTERYERLVTRRTFATEVESFEHWRSVSERDGGFVMITAHLGMYEVGSMIPATAHARRVHLVREPEVDPRAQEFIRRSVAAVEGDHFTMHFQSDDPLQGVRLLEALRRHEIVAMQADRPRRGAKTVDAELFGRPFAFPSGPASLARAADVPMLPVFAVREGRRRYRLVFAPPIRVARTADRGRDVAEAVRRAGAEIEAAILRAPHQWFVFRALW